MPTNVVVILTNYVTHVVTNTLAVTNSQCSCIMTNIVTNTNNSECVSLSLVNSIHDLYGKALTHIEWIVGVVLAFAGVFLPLLIQYFQRRSFDVELKNTKEYTDAAKSELKKDVEENNARLNAKTSELSKKMQGELEQRVHEITERFDKKTHNLTGKILMTAAYSLFIAEQLTQAAEVCVSAASEHLDEGNRKKSADCADMFKDYISFFIEHIKQKINAKEYDKLKQAIDKFAEKIKGKKLDGEYGDILEVFRNNFSKLKKPESSAVTGAEPIDGK